MSSLGEIESIGVFKKTRQSRIWRVCLPCNKDSGSDRGMIRQKRNSEHAGQRKGTEWKEWG